MPGVDGIAHEFHSSHAGQRPFHCGVSSPHCWHRYNSLTLAPTTVHTTPSSIVTHHTHLFVTTSWIDAVVMQREQEERGGQRGYLWQMLQKSERDVVWGGHGRKVAQGVATGV